MSIAKAKTRRSRAYNFLVFLLVTAIIIAVAVAAKNIITDLYDRHLRITYPLKYNDLVLNYAREFGIDPFLIYAIIDTESDFKPDSVSKVGARGLMQLMTDTVDWVAYRLDDDETDFSDAFDPDINIRYGSYLISYLLGKFDGDFDCALAAYHAGAGSVESWLSRPEYSSDGKTLSVIPMPDTAHYVFKIHRAYDAYNKLYNNN